MGHIKVIVEMLYIILEAIDNRDRGKVFEAVSLFSMYVGEVYGYKMVYETIPVVEAIEEAIDASDYAEALRPVVALLDALESSPVAAEFHPVIH